MKMNWGREGKRKRERVAEMEGSGGQSREGCLVGGGERCKDQILDLPPLCLAGYVGIDNTHVRKWINLSNIILLPQMRLEMKCNSSLSMEPSIANLEY